MVIIRHMLKKLGTKVENIGIKVDQKIIKESRCYNTNIRQNKTKDENH